VELNLIFLNFQAGRGSLTFRYAATVPPTHATSPTSLRRTASTTLKSSYNGFFSLASFVSP
jgi:hypothetical protein